MGIEKTAQAIKVPIYKTCRAARFYKKVDLSQDERGKLEKMKRIGMEIVDCGQMVTVVTQNAGNLSGRNCVTREYHLQYAVRARHFVFVIPGMAIGSSLSYARSARLGTVWLRIAPRARDGHQQHVIPKNIVISGIIRRLSFPSHFSDGFSLNSNCILDLNASVFAKSLSRLLKSSGCSS